MLGLAIVGGATLLACAGDDDDDAVDPTEGVSIEDADPTTGATEATVTMPVDPSEQASEEAETPGGSDSGNSNSDCPDLGSVEAPGDNPDEQAVAAVAAETGAQLEPEDVASGPASESAYSLIVAAQCGQETVDLSWWVMVCPGPCSQTASASLPVDYFLVNSGGEWQVYFVN
ncbi:MAG: hypothetical protein GEU28_11830 [Dehalococcoidia bacterium]|nr:hypothetical protein [Dehalococcoidia bacterium]